MLRLVTMAGRYFCFYDDGDSGDLGSVSGSATDFLDQLGQVINMRVFQK